MIYQGFHTRGLTFSPDGRQCAFYRGDPAARALVLMVMEIERGAPRPLLALSEPQGFGSLAWTRDGRHIVFTKWLSPADEFWIVPVTGGEARKLGSVSGHAYGLTFHPSGKQLGFNILQSSYELWTLENFMPAPDAEVNR